MEQNVAIILVSSVQFHHGQEFQGSISPMPRNNPQDDSHNVC